MIYCSVKYCYQRYILLGLILPCSLLSEIYSSWSYSSMLSLIRDIFFLVLFFHALSYQRYILLGLILLILGCSSYSLLFFLLFACSSCFLLCIFLLFFTVLFILWCSSYSLLFFLFFAVSSIIRDSFFFHLFSFLIIICMFPFLAELDCTWNYSLLFSVCRTSLAGFFSTFWHHELTTRMITYLYINLACLSVCLFVCIQ